MFEKRRIEALQNREIGLEERITGLITAKNRLVDQVDELKITNKRLQKRKDMDQEEIAHKLKMREEEHDINYQKKEQKLLGECADKIRKEKDKYQDKVEKYLEGRGNELKEMYTEILERLPNINIKGKI